MKRSEIKTGDVLAYQRSPYYEPARAVVLTDEPMVSTRPRYGYGKAELLPITLPDGTVIEAPARPPKSYDSAMDKGVLISLVSTSLDGTTSDHYAVVALRTLVGHYDPVIAAHNAAAARKAQAAADAEALRQAKYQEYVGLRERVQALVAPAGVTEGRDHTVELDRTTLAALLDLAERGYYDDPANDPTAQEN